MKTGSGGEQPTLTVSVGIATYRRHPELRRLLEALAGVERPEDLLRWIGTLVVDNSPDGDAEWVVQAADSLGLPGLRYVHEPLPGLSAARNALVANTQGDLIAFVDDDEVPTDRWLVELERTLTSNIDAHAVVGPVHYVFERPAPQWLVQSRLFEPMHMTDGEPPEYFATGNAMIRRDLVDSLGPLFDPFFGELGGEDHHLGLRLHEMGATILAAPNAIVDEHVPIERIDKRWAAKRLLRKGSSLALTETRLVHGTKRLEVQLTHAVKGFARVGQGVVLLIAAVPTRGRGPWGGYRSILMGIGEISGALNRAVHEYRRSA